VLPVGATELEPTVCPPLSGGIPNPDGRVCSHQDTIANQRRIEDTDPLEQKSRVTAFVNTDEGLKVECWQIGDLLPKNQVTRADGSKGTVSQRTLAGNIAITLFSFAPSVTIFSFGATGIHSNAIDFRAKPK